MPRYDKALLPNSPYRGGAIEKADAAYASYLAKGMRLDDYPGETLQCRNELDRTNWLGLARLCERAVENEKAYYEANSLPLPSVLGDYPIPAPGIRCTSNNFIRPTVAATLALMDQIVNYASAAQANWWRLKDLARTAETLADLEAIDMEAGWP